MEVVKPKSSFQQVAVMNTAFGNPKGNPANINWERLEKQCKNIKDEFNELMDAIAARDVEQVRDALCDVSVFALGGQHFLGVDGDADMAAVIEGVMTRFCRDQKELEETIAFWHAKGVTQVYVGGQFPRAVVKSSVDQPDAPKGKFLKSVGYTQTVFPPFPGADDLLGEDQ